MLPCLIQMVKFNKCIKAKVWPPSVSILAPSLLPHKAKRDLLLDRITALPKPFNGFLLHVNIHSLELTPSTTDGVPTPAPFNFAQVTRFLSVLLNAKFFPTSDFCTCYFLCLECVSFCFSHEWVFLIHLILTEMSLPQRSLSWPYYFKLVSSFSLYLCTPFPS